MSLLTYEYDCLHLEGEDKGKITSHSFRQLTWNVAIRWAELVNSDPNSPIAVLELRHPTREKVVFDVKK